MADHPAAVKDERAGIWMEHVIGEDYLVEAVEILELYCDLLLAQFSLIQATKWDLLNLHHLQAQRNDKESLPPSEGGGGLYLVGTLSKNTVST